MSSISENLSSIQNQLEIALERTTPSTHNVPSNPSSLQISDHAQHAALQEQRQMEAIQRQIRLEQILQSSDNHHILELPTDHEYFRTVGNRNRNIDAPEPRPGELLPPISQNERSRRNHLRLLSNRLAMHQLLSEDSLLSQNTHDPLCCCSLTAIVSDKKRYQHSLNILLASGTLSLS
ncbi:hypothetical protein BCR33DRAFT_737595 [Rhizoclosmatium globosum]|uniref:Uncharacterized protein n=1 Tax=Rhizoclosmatium globosum TaxID=329046 RepID=A0A1Y2CDW8_9FUNG|nr:hypothetical protein BCR33DRAFT_737595 [Rhizoclosmatium globosum]|eukprot:ORY45233.1 hypothetical protein BCR33DRAFT_737595 [Rhizoclosmatium globosum]